MHSFEFNYLSKAEVLASLSICERTLENLVKAQHFPPGVKIGRAVYWSPAVVQKWLDAKFQAQMAFSEKPKRRMPR